MKNISENTIKLFKSNYKLAISEYYNLLQEYKTTYDNFILGLENESNSNQ